MTGADGSIVIRVWFGGDEPPTGVVRGIHDGDVPFTGWLELLHAIARVAGGAGASGPPADTSRHELDVMKGSEP